MSDPAGADAISPERLYGQLRAGEPVALLDVRDRDEFEAWRIDGGAVSTAQIPHARFIQARVRGDIGDLVADLGEPLTVVCARGEASAEVAAQLSAAGVEAYNLAGGMEGWARVYDTVEIPHPEVTVRQYLRPATGCLSALVVAGNEAAVVDPLAAFAGRYVDDAAAAGADLRYAVDTHVHADHVSGLRRLADAAGAEPVLPAGATDRGLAFDARSVADGDRLPLGGAALTARHLPGHTSEMTGFGLDGLRFTGDTVFESGVARPDLEAGTEGARDLAARLHRTIHERLLTLPDDARLAPGHRESGVAAGATLLRVGALRADLPALALDREAFVERITRRMPPRPRNHGRIVDANLGKRDLGDREAFEVELGPNNCAAA